MNDQERKINNLVLQLGSLNDEIKQTVIQVNHFHQEREKILIEIENLEKEKKRIRLEILKVNDDLRSLVFSIKSELVALEKNSKERKISWL